MHFLDIFLIGIGLAMDAFAVSVCKGLSITHLKKKYILTIASYFGLFQAIMPLLGYILGITFQSFIANFSHWIAFLLLSSIGIHMLCESFHSEKKIINNTLQVKHMLLLALATSLDALAIGVTFSLFPISIFIAANIIGIITFILSCIGVWLGHQFGHHFHGKAEIIGGIILILIGFKILLEHF